MSAPPPPPGPPLPAALEQLIDQLAQRLAQHLQAQLSVSGSEDADSSPWLSTERAAAYLDWPTQRLYKLSAAGAIPYYKHEGRLVFHRHELDSWLNQYAQGPRP